ncbi:PriCT-2 domain-containing protein [Burkholderia cenocepacia]|uniref:phage/plasmid primase, P4 family n=1 Tax=Burkholderia cenocepacia TaxID=95486 RepID=UPI00222E5F39|nr:phage/plasmid primase, P4 family [Burkholderia cenocepacia]MCW3521230.1 PriCT-2 domain-containing protein [Burkholderia cenocepacia]MCW3612377.1 PriCT-2 domain-containing protein [Burkholderia cenocepacia]MCW3650215.1 PriCT-2 domain-containing protein [Burkholderia cenocepacia]MCW3664248.1 PriCT-2 domain-containing protein [Burkholderia cenocepacia]MCW3678998.1 PriCT-2 domain-containing protein [Burkholderia cenocepacia]
MNNETLVAALAPIVSRVVTSHCWVKRDGPPSHIRKPLTAERLAHHVNGGPAYGAAQIEPGASTTRIACLDLDSHKGETSWHDMQAAALRVMAALEARGMRPIPFRSSGGAGLHIYMLWEEPQDAYSVRCLLRDALAACELRDGVKGVAAGQVEIFPKQNSVPTDGFGNMFVLPLAGKSVPLDSFELDDMPKAFAAEMDWPTSAAVPHVEREEIVMPGAVDVPVELETLKSALDMIPNAGDDELDYEEWRNVVFAIHHAARGSDDGLALAHAFSARSSKYNPQFLDERVWPHIGKTSSDERAPITGRTVLHLARAHGWQEPIEDDFEVAARVEAIAVGAPRAAEPAAEAREGAPLDDDEVIFVESNPPAKPPRAAKKKGADEPPKGYRARTEFGNAERMLDRFGAGLMYVPELEAWFIWTGVYWRRAVQVELENMAKETIRALPDEAEDLQTAEERIEFFKFCAACQKAAMVSNMIRLAASDPRVVVPVTELDRHTHLLGVANGAVDLRTGALLPPDKEHRITVVTPLSYDPRAAAPLFEQTVRDVFFSDDEQIEFFQRLIGYALMGVPIEDLLAIPYGMGSNGKSTVLGAIRSAFGGHAKSASAETFLSAGAGGGGAAGAAREDLLRLRGARFVYVSEPDEGSELREGLIKSMTGGDPIPARGMYAKATVEIVPTWVAFMPTNHRPIVKGDDHAIWRRLMLVPFTRNFDRDPDIVKDPGRAQRIAAELAGVLAWCVRGALAYQQHGLKPPKTVAAARDAYKADMDLLGEWMDERCRVDHGAAASNEDLWRSWRAFAEQRGELRFIANSRALARRLGARGFLQVKDTHGIRGRGFAGICVNDEADFDGSDLG